MPSAQSATRSVVPQLMSSVKRLTPAELRDFKQRFMAWQQTNGGEHFDEDALVQTCQARLPSVDERRLKTLIRKSERGVLRPNELEAYRTLVRRAEQLDATRLVALSQLARRWGKPVRDVMELVGSEGKDAAATRHPAGTKKARARSRR
jgi:hypothetical protein